ncbi:hypothetical protein CIPAW_10G128700 [Carya illinoinensis]|uniref:Uncharacterized protein n=1 Tax=Carya illinoinensis TaxID=32201 RepID=A0A8T1PDM8_CARIL|nr:hypothetical protein CIPAW_10G128700 [Carya illinoinensis]
MAPLLQLKLSPHFYGPFTARSFRSSDLLPNPLIYPPQPGFIQCSMSNLKKKLGSQIQPIPTLPPVDKNGKIQPEPELIVDRRLMCHGNRPVTEDLIKWAGTSSDINTWETLWKMRELYPHLVGKVV